MDYLEALIQASKMQAESFLLDAGEFYPFGNYIDNEDKIKPLIIELENDMPKSEEVIVELEQHFKSQLLNNYKLAAIATDIFLTINDEKFDGLQIRIFDFGKEVSEFRFKYVVNKDNVDFNIQ